MMSNLPIQAKISIHNGIIQSVEPQIGGVIIEVSGEKTQRFSNAWVMPGLVETHAHLLGVGMKMAGISLSSARSPEQCIDILKRKATNNRGDWITATGWNEQSWQNPILPDKDILDEHFPDVPLFLQRADYHSAWVNSEALRRANISHSTRSPHGGTIVKDKYREPTGLFIDTAVDLIRPFIPSYSAYQLEAMMEAGMQKYLRYGVTEIHDMDVSPEYIAMYDTLHQNKKLPLRLHSFVSGQKDEYITENVDIKETDFHIVNSVKFFADGALGSRGAFLLDPYSDKEDTVGLPSMKSTVLKKKITKAVEKGWNCAVHAIGDAANRMVLEIYGAIRRNDNLDNTRTLRIEHAQHLTEQDIELFAEWNVIPAVQAIHCTSDAFMAQRRLGSQRCNYAYPWRSLKDAGALLIGGSDAPVETANPLAGIDAFCRRTPMGEQMPWHPEQVLTRKEAIDCYTTMAHRATKNDHRRGRLQQGYDADFVVFDRNTLSSSPEELFATNALAVFTGGKLRFQA